jgi:hypothetical protein
VLFESAAPPRAGEEGGTFRYAVTPGYLETRAIPLRRGRSLTERDWAGAPLVALILFQAFALIALVLAAAGIHGLIVGGVAA